MFQIYYLIMKGDWGGGGGRRGREFQMLFCHRYQIKYCYLLGHTAVLNYCCYNPNSINGRKGENSHL